MGSEMCIRDRSNPKKVEGTVEDKGAPLQCRLLLASDGYRSAAVFENRLDYRSVGQAVPDSPGVNDCRSDVLLTSG